MVPKDGAEELIKFDMKCGQPQGLSLRVDIEFNLTATVSRYISANSLGGSKPPSYTVEVNLMLNTATKYHAKSNNRF